jgi:hypothetical protein
VGIVAAKSLSRRDERSGNLLAGIVILIAIIERDQLIPGPRFPATSQAGQQRGGLCRRQCPVGGGEASGERRAQPLRRHADREVGDGDQEIAADLLE